MGKNMVCDYYTENIPIIGTKCQNNPLKISDLVHHLKTLNDYNCMQHIENCKCDRLTTVEFPPIIMLSSPKKTHLKRNHIH